MSDMKVTGQINGQEADFYSRALNEYESEIDRSVDGAYRTEVVAEDAYGNVSVAHETAYTDDEWIEPIWWRTQQDLNRAEYLNLKISEEGRVTALSPEEQREWLSGMIGCLNDWDLSRIEIDTKWLYNRLYACGYGWGPKEHKTDWGMTDIPYAKEMERIRTNLSGLIDLYHRQDAEVPTSISRPNYLDFNAMERVLYELKDMIRRMVESYRFCGACICGQDLVF